MYNMKKLLSLLFSITILAVSCQSDNEGIPNPTENPNPDPGGGNGENQQLGAVGYVYVNYTDTEGNNLIDPTTGVVNVSDIEIRIFDHDDFYNVNEVWPSYFYTNNSPEYSDPQGFKDQPNVFCIQVHDLFSPYYSNLISNHTPAIVFKQQHVWPDGSIDTYEFHTVYAGWSRAYNFKKAYHNGTLIYDVDTYRDNLFTEANGAIEDEGIVFYTVVKEGY